MRSEVSESLPDDLMLNDGRYNDELAANGKAQHTTLVFTS
jgi:hypothetical protein